MKSFYLPCHCSQRLEVTTGQAGGLVTCSSCGEAISVPKLRDFQKLEPVQRSHKVQKGHWRRAHSFTLAGSTIAVLAFVSAFWLTSQPVTLDPEVVRNHVMSNYSDQDIIKAWKTLSRSGVARQPFPHEKYIQQQYYYWMGVSRGLSVFGAIGMCIAVAGIGMLVKDRINKE